jgi:crossover junction endodeoxyribonuclease RusA
MIVTLHYPISANRYWRQVRLPSRTAILVSREAVAYKRHVGAVCAAAGARPLLGDVEMWLWLHPRATKTGAASKVRFDLDNVLKVAIDACSGHLYVNDRQVTKLHAFIAHAVTDGQLIVRAEPATNQD